MLAGVELRNEQREGLGSEGVPLSDDAFKSMRQRLKGGAGVEWNVDAGEGCDAIEELRVKAEAKVGERSKFRWILGVTCGEHARGGSGGFGERLALLQYCDARSSAVQFEGEGEADDACSGDADVGTIHKTSLDGREEDIVCLSAVVSSTGSVSPRWRKRRH